MVPLSSCGRDALLLRRDDVEGHDRQHRAVHRHRHRHLSERNLVEEDLHVLDRIDRHARLADVARHALVIRVVAAMRRQIEGDRESLLSRRQIAPVEGIRLLRGREARVLPDGPRLHRVHRGVRTAQERRHARRVIQMLHARTRSSAVYHGFTAMCSAVFQTGAPSAGPAGSAAAASQPIVNLREIRSHCAAPHAQPVLPLGQRLHRVAEDVHEALHARGLQCFHLLLRIAGDQHRHRHRRADFLRQRRDTPGRNCTARSGPRRSPA